MRSGPQVVALVTSDHPPPPAPSAGPWRALPGGDRSNAPRQSPLLLAQGNLGGVTHLQQIRSALFPAECFARLPTRSRSPTLDLAPAHRRRYSMSQWLDIARWVRHGWT